MIILTSYEALAHASQAYPFIPPPILERYVTLIDLAWLFIIQPGDSAADLATVRQRPFECWEFIIAESGWFEAVFVLSDDGFGHVVLIPDRSEIDATLLTICRNHAEKAEGR
ncbi:hypothetical protein [Alteriqipengyuania sp. 357]